MCKLTDMLRSYSKPAGYITTMRTAANEIDNLRASLDYAISEAEGLHDECRGYPIENSKMDLAKKLLYKN